MKGSSAAYKKEFLNPLNPKIETLSARKKSQDYNRTIGKKKFVKEQCPKYEKGYFKLFLVYIYSNEDLCLSRILWGMNVIITYSGCRVWLMLVTNLMSRMANALLI